MFKQCRSVIRQLQGVAIYNHLSTLLTVKDESWRSLKLHTTLKDWYDHVKCQGREQGYVSTTVFP